MDQQTKKVIVATMEEPRLRDLSKTKYRAIRRKQPLRNKWVLSAVSLCIGVGALYAYQRPDMTKTVMNHLSADFEYDQSLGMLQYVSNMLPESAEVFLNSHADETISMPVNASATHGWTANEPWLEYEHIGDVIACSDGEVLTVVKNHCDEYTVRILHRNGIESVYSGLSAVHIGEEDTVFNGESIGTSAGCTAFELRKNGLSIQPSFLTV